MKTDVEIQNSNSIDLNNLLVSDLFNLAELQQLQDLFADAHEVASIITHPDGSPITSPSHFTRLCNEIIRKTEKGCANCYQSDAVLGSHSPGGPIVQPCLSGGLWDAGASITVGGKHIANWLIGQVRNEALNEEQMLAYADEIGVSRHDFKQALKEVPQMPVEKFKKIAQMLFAFANELSAKAFNNLQLKMQIVEREKAAAQLEESRKILSTTLHSIGDGVISTDINGLIVNMNPVAENLCGWALLNATGRPLTEVFNIVNAETHEAVANPVKNVLKKGEIVGLANHTVLISKNGTEYQIADSAAPIKNKDGEITGVVLVFSDISEQYTAQKQIKESELKYRSFIESSSDAIFCVDEKGEYKFTNHLFASTFGKTPEYFTGKTFWDVYDKEHADYRYAATKRLFQTGKSESLEVEVPLPDKTLYFLATTNPIKDESGNVILNLTHAADITVLKQAENALRESEEKFRLLYTAMDQGLALHEIITDENGKPVDYVFLDINDSYTRLLGVTREMSIGRRIKEVMPKVEQYWIDIFGKVALTGEPSYYENYLESTGKYYSTYSYSPKKNQFAVLVNDITERQLNENLRRQLSDRLSLAVRAGGVGVWDYDIVNNILLWDDQMFALYGIDKNKFSGAYEAWRSVLHPDDMIRSEDEIQMAIRGEKDFDTEFRVFWPDRTVRNIRALAIIQRDHMGTPLHMIGTNWDITIQKQNEQELIKAKEKAEESDRLKSAFLANMSHEIRTPMNGILGFTQLMKEPELTGDEHRNYIRIIEKSGARLLNIINDIVDMSKIEAGLMETTISETNVNEKVDFIYNFFKPEAELKKIQFSFNRLLPVKEAFIKTDPEKIYAILTNLVSNAMKFTHEGSIEFGYEKKGKYLEFYVKDTGIGISEQNKEIIFERFRQGDKLISKNYEGTGLGLSISKSYVEMLGGTMWVESEYGKGATFYFTLPYNVETEQKDINKEDPSANRAEHHVKNLKILIAEDDENSEFLLITIVKKISADILNVRTGVEAVEACRNNPGIDLVLMDITMPKLNGYEATRQIRGFNKDVIIIAQTAYAQAGDREKAIEAGCNDYISKPLNHSLLLELIHKYFK